MKEKPYAFPYCLACYAPLEAELATGSHELGAKAKARRNARASIPCTQCDSVNLRVDIKDHWTKEPRIVEVEWWLKASVVLVIAVMSFATLMTRQTGLSAAGHGMVVGAPILSAIVLWDLMSITRKRGLFNGGILWGVAVPALVLSVGLVVILFTGTVQYGDAAIGGAFIVICAPIPMLLKRCWEAARVRYVAHAQSKLLAR
jgi:hypothetical protein